MPSFPVIRTAIPKRRFRVGDQNVTLLGEIESGDGVSYRWIMAFVQDGQARPGLFVCAEKNRPGSEAAYRLRVVNAVMAEVVEQLLAGGASKAAADREGLTAADLARRAGHDAVLALLED
jgi:hypothetical protein